MLGTWEWLIFAALATAVIWLFWPKSWRIIPHARFSVRWLMVAVLVIGVLCGGAARWYSRELRRQSLIAQLHVQQQVTDSVMRQSRIEIIAAGRKDFSFLIQDSFELDQWTEQLDAFVSQGDRKLPLIFVEVSGGCDDEDLLRPITIKTSGASMEDSLVDRLIRAYRDRGWQHAVVSTPATDK
jgi:hypothetical protein